ncbi:MAG: GDP-mannose mannosyl hydrolase [Campylobacterales bacterium]|nr:GDP-mannose mannosyl hydrolase [Campylobacterales bacterium]
MFLTKKLFASIIQNTPLVSIDLIVENDVGEILLGKRINEPAKNFWFVPGGRIFKDESLDSAFERIVQEELGISLKRSDAHFQNVYEHFYKNNVFNENISTHYIVLAYKLKTTQQPLLNSQHSKYCWFKYQDILTNPHVHQYTKNYFLDSTQQK